MTTPKTIDDGGPAFARAMGPLVDGGVSQEQRGMSLRDWFAGQALVGLLSEKGDEPHDSVSYGVWASHAYGLANAMLAARRQASPAPAERGESC